MSYVVTLVSGMDKISDGSIQICQDYLREECNWTDISAPSILSDRALDFTRVKTPNSKNLSRPQLGKLRSLLAGDKIDCLQSSIENRRKKLLIADMDSTILSGETLDELADELNIKHKITEITERAMNGELDFHSALRERVAMLKGLSEDKILQTINRLEFNPGARVLVETLKHHGVKTILVSGGFEQFTSWVGTKCGFDHMHSNQLLIEQGKLTGKVRDPIQDAQSKQDWLVHYTRIYGFKDYDVLAVGDGANDRDMLVKATKDGGIGVGYYPKPKLAKSLENNIWQSDLTALLYMQGYTENDIIKTSTL